MQRSYFAALFSLFCSVAAAQSFPFVVRVQQPNNAAVVSNGATITTNAVIGSSETFSVTLTYAGSGVATLPGGPTLEGSASFTLENQGSVPAVLSPNQSYSFQVRFSARSSAAVTGQIELPFSENIPGPNSTTLVNQGRLLLQLQGTAPELVVSYLLPDILTNIQVNSGSSIPFGPTALNATDSVILSILNRGSGSGEVASILVSGEEFQALGLVLLPVTLQPRTELRFSIRFRPLLEGLRTGRLAISAVNRNFDIALSGQAFSTRFAYELIGAEGISPVVPGGVIDFGEALPGESLGVQLLVRNVNPVAVAFPPAAVFGQGFTLLDSPAGRTLRPGETVQVFLQAIPAQVGVLRGRLRLGDDNFDLLATGTGAQLRYSYTVGSSGSIAVAPGASIFFPGSRIGVAEQARVTVRNNGITEASVVNVSLADPAAPFSLQGLPSLPLRLAPGQEFTFNVAFQPVASGQASVVLRIDGATFLLSGSSSPLPPLPSYSFTLPSGNVSPLQQPSIGLELSAGYPLAISGTLTLSQEASGFVPDPSVRFINGSETVAFTIPANSRQAIFSNGLSSIRFQTGGVAGTIFIRANFTAAGSALADPNPQIPRFTISPAAPRILSLQAAPGANALVLTITGLTVTRSLTALDLQLVPAPGFSLAKTNFRVNLEGESLAWFRSAASAASGGIFTLQLPLNFSISGNASGSGVSNLIESIDSVTVVLANETGSSTSSSLSLR